MKHCDAIIDVTDDDTLNKGAIDVFCEVKPEWVREDIHLEHLAGGTTNRIVLGWCRDTSNKLLIRFRSISCISSNVSQLGFNYEQYFAQICNLLNS